MSEGSRKRGPDEEEHAVRSGGVHEFRNVLQEDEPEAPDPADDDMDDDGGAAAAPGPALPNTIPIVNGREIGGISAIFCPVRMGLSDMTKKEVADAVEGSHPILVQRAIDIEDNPKPVPSETIDYNTDVAPYRVEDTDQVDETARALFDAKRTGAPPGNVRAAIVNSRSFRWTPAGEGDILVFYPTATTYAPSGTVDAFGLFTGEGTSSFAPNTFELGTPGMAKVIIRTEEIDVHDINIMSTWPVVTFPVGELSPHVYCTEAWPSEQPVANPGVVDERFRDPVWVKLRSSTEVDARTKFVWISSHVLYHRMRLAMRTQSAFSWSEPVTWDNPNMLMLEDGSPVTFMDKYDKPEDMVPFVLYFDELVFTQLDLQCGPFLEFLVRFMNEHMFEPDVRRQDVLPSLDTNHPDYKLFLTLERLQPGETFDSFPFLRRVVFYVRFFMHPLWFQWNYLHKRANQVFHLIKETVFYRARDIHRYRAQKNGRTPDEFATDVARWVLNEPDDLSDHEKAFTKAQITGLMD